jgi:pyrroloquinoline quinone biosynthesis protein D
MSAPPPGTDTDMAPAAWTPALRSSIVLRRDPVTGGDLLVMPERVVVLNDTGAAILRLCDGRRSVDDIAGELAGRYTVAGDGGRDGGEVRADVAELLDRMRREGWLR